MFRIGRIDMTFRIYFRGRSRGDDSMRQRFRRSLARRPALLGVAVGAGAAILPALAQSPATVLKLEDPGGFVEAYLEQPPQSANRGAVVGATIVGVRLDGPDAPFDPANVRVRLGAAAAASNGKLCLKVISRDGRYFARGQYPASAGSDPAPIVEFKTAYKAILAGYSNRDVAASAFRSANCNTQSDQQLVASQLTPTAAPNSLVVQIRAGEARVRAQLAQGTTAIGEPVLCNRFNSGSTVGYTGECALKLPAGLKSGLFQINIGETTSSGDIRVKTYPLSLWLDG